MALNLTDLFVVARTADGKNYKVTVSELLTLIGSGGSSSIILGLDGQDGEDGFGFPGAPGIPGAAGRDGSSVFMLAEDPIEPDLIVIPGVQGIQGVAGVTGASASPIWLPTFDEPTAAEDMIPAEYSSDKNIVYLGNITGTGVTVGPLVWNEIFDRIFFEYQIGGYNGGTPVARFMCGSAAITTTGLTNGNGLLEGATLNVTSVSKPGCPLAVTLSNIARSGWGCIRGASGALKQIDIYGMTGNPAVATAPTVFTARSFFSDLGTNLPIQRIQLTTYDTLIATAVSAQTLIATTYIRAWGWRKNP